MAGGDNGTHNDGMGSKEEGSKSGCAPVVGSWQELHDPAVPAAGKIEAASKLLHSPAADSRIAVWLFEWLAGGSPVWTKKMRLNAAGVHLLCDLLERLPALYPVGSQIPLIIMQLQSVLVPGAESSMQLLELHVKLIALLLRRPVMSFRLSPEQALPLFNAGVAAAERQLSCSSGCDADEASALLQMVVGVARFVEGSLESANPKKGFKTLVDLLPAISRLLACVSDDLWTRQSSGLPSLAMALGKLMNGLFDQRHLEGFEMLSRSLDGKHLLEAASQGDAAEPDKKKARKGKEEPAARAQPNAATYQTGFFRSVADLVRTDQGVQGCRRLLPMLFDGFLAEYRRLAARRCATGLGDDADQKKKNNATAATVLADLPCEFWFFRQLSHALKTAIKMRAADKDAHAARGQTTELVRCLVALWRRVRENNVYRPREDPKLLQAKTLATFCKDLCERLSDCSPGPEALEAPEFDGLVEALKLDPSPFEQRLDALWTAIGSLAPRAVEAAASEGGGCAPCINLALCLLRTYAGLADLPSCAASLSQWLRSAGKKKASRLLSNEDFVQGLQQAAEAVSAGSMSATQATEIWQKLLEELEAGGFVWWACKLLESFLHGLQVTELALQQLQQLLLRTFELLDKMSTVADAPPRCDFHGLLLASCCVGRQCGSWQLPTFLKPLAGEDATIARHVASGLQHLAKALLAGDSSPGEETEIHVRGAVHWLALNEQERGILVEGEGVDGSTSASGPAAYEVLDRILELAAPDAGSAEARKAVSTWPRLFLATAARQGQADSGRRKRKRSGGVTEEAVAEEAATARSANDFREETAGTAALARVFLPEEEACWRHLAERWQLPSASASSSSERYQKQRCSEAWAAPAQLWIAGAEVVVEPEAAMQAPMLRRFSAQIREAAGSTGEHGGKRGQLKRRSSVLLGLHGALLRATTAPLRAAPPAVLLEVLRSVVLTTTFVQGLLVAETGRGGDSQAPMDVLVPLMVLALRCVAQITEMFTFLSPDEHGETCRDAIASILGGASTTPSATKKRKKHTGFGGAVAAAVATMSAAWPGSGTTKEQQRQDGLSVATALSSVAAALFRFRYALWSEADRRDWATELLRQIAGAHLVTKNTAHMELGTASLCVSLPDPGAENVAVINRSMELLIASVEGASTAAAGAAAAGLSQALAVVLQLDPIFKHLQDHRLLERGGSAARACIGLCSTLLARCAELAGGLSMESARSRLQVPAGDERSRLQLLVQAVSAVVHEVKLQDQSACLECAGWEKLRVGTSRLIVALSSSWPVVEDSADKDEADELDEVEILWQETWLPLVIDWTELLPWSSLSVAEKAGETPAAMRLESWLGTACCRTLCSSSSSSSSRWRREKAVESLAARVAALAEKSTTTGCSRCLPPLLGTAGALAGILQGMGQNSSLHPAAAGRVAAAARSLLSLTTQGSESKFFAQWPGCHTGLLLAGAAISEALFNNLVERHPKAGRSNKDPHYKLGEAEALLLHLAGRQGRGALELAAPSGAKLSKPEAEDKTRVMNQSYSALLSSVYVLMSALFSSVPSEGKKLPTWTQKPHILLSILKVMLEAVYSAPTGAQAAAIAADTTRLWEAFSLGGTRLVARSAGRSGQSIFQAKVQRATQSFVIMLVAHALEQQRAWAGVDAATQKSLQKLAPQMRAEARPAETAAWKEASSLVQAGMHVLLSSLEGADHLKQSLYVSLREPLTTMFKELNENFQKRSKYKGEA
eukprot:TRINITY_DN47107_c0_g1_i1.p1 TRINITY_DN47107_c0_g1~~TRINITY_DN47107_c0_g1_i1.p1  ORF type:complete len:1737 (+),score=449.88 TRINITY_DN47107_c0_g1_i1:78-5288(+)